MVNSIAYLVLGIFAITIFTGIIIIIRNQITIATYKFFKKKKSKQKRNLPTYQSGEINTIYYNIGYRLISK
jgi:hypothetical protein